MGKGASLNTPVVLVDSKRLTFSWLLELVDPSNGGILLDGG